jgi:hypothetical protein
MAKLRDPKNLTHTELVNLARALQDALWPRGDLDAEWDSDTLDSVARAMAHAGLNVRAVSARGR